MPPLLGRRRWCCARRRRWVLAGALRLALSTRLRSLPRALRLTLLSGLTWAFTWLAVLTRPSGLTGLALLLARLLRASLL